MKNHTTQIIDILKVASLWFVFHIINPCDSTSRDRRSSSKSYGTRSEAITSESYQNWNFIIYSNRNIKIRWYVRSSRIRGLITSSISWGWEYAFDISDRRIVSVQVSFWFLTILWNSNDVIEVDLYLYQTINHFMIRTYSFWTCINFFNDRTIEFSYDKMFFSMISIHCFNFEEVELRFWTNDVRLCSYWSHKLDGTSPLYWIVNSWR